jgi:uncharacterized protein YjiS (DUF1127 family)
MTNLDAPIRTQIVAENPAVRCRLWRLLKRWAQRARQRRALGDLDDRLRGDIGVSRAQAETERRKPFWR